MGRVGHENLRALMVFVVLMVGTNNHKTCQLTVCSGKRIESELAQTCYVGQCLLHVVVSLKRALACLCRLKRVERGESRHCGSLFIDYRIVFHCAAAQRIESVVHTEIVFAVVCVMPHHCELVALRNLRVGFSTCA